MKKIKICFFAPAESSHTEKWSKWFVNMGYEVHIISFKDASIEGAHVHALLPKVNTKGSDFQKLQYFFAVSKFCKIVKAISPDILSVHYASSYGVVAAVAGKHPYFLSVWGSDIYDFPRKSFLHKNLLKFSLQKADFLLSTSKAMAKEASQYTDREFAITPFGVDMDLFSSERRTRTGDDFVIGTVKTLSPKYGIDYLLKAAAIVKENHPEIPIKLRISGKGPNELEYKELAEKLGIAGMTTWLGFIPQEQAAEEWANMDLAVVYSSSDSESFGVSAVEAQACGVPIIVSDVPGLMEATSPGKSSVIVPKKNELFLADAIYELYIDSEKRKSMGTYGRQFVMQNYSLEGCFSKIENCLRNM